MINNIAVEKNWLEAKSLDASEILSILPHRYPFLMVDRVLDIQPSIPLNFKMTEAELFAARKGSFALTQKMVSHNEEVFQGHFPGNPIFPGVLTLEVMAQSAAFVTVPFVAARYQGRLPKLGVVLVGFDFARFRKPIKPGSMLDVKVTASSGRGAIWGFSGEVFVNQQLVAEGSFMAHLSSESESNQAALKTGELK